MYRRRLVFVTYYRLVPTQQIGVFKRCMRLIQRLVADFEIHLVNFGPLPEEDALFSELRPQLKLAQHSDEKLGQDLMRILQEIAPEAVILGEAPLRGSMRLTHRVASALGLFQLCIDNYYGEFVGTLFPAEWPRIDGWLLLGLTPGGQAGAARERVEVVPPLVKFPDPGARLERDRVVILGYDRQTLLMGMRLLGRLPLRQKVDILVSPDWESLVGRRRDELTRPGRRVLVLPGDDAIYTSISQARFVLGKGGYQQIVESIALGAPIVCQICGGGVDDSLIAPYLKPYVRFVATDADLERVLFDLAGWLLEPPKLPWLALAAQVPEPAAHAASRLAALLAQRPGAGGEPGPAATLAGPERTAPAAQEAEWARG